MKKVYDRRMMVKFEGEDKWLDTSIWRHLVYEHEKVAEQDYHFDLLTFDYAYSFCEDFLINAEATTTFFGKKPKIVISTADFDYKFYFTEKNFKPFEVKIVYDDASDLSISALSKMLKADEFCEYLKERGLSCPKL